MAFQPPSEIFCDVIKHLISVHNHRLELLGFQEGGVGELVVLALSDNHHPKLAAIAKKLHRRLQP